MRATGGEEEEEMLLWQFGSAERELKLGVELEIGQSRKQKVELNVTRRRGRRRRRRINVGGSLLQLALCLLFINFICSSTRTKLIQEVNCDQQQQQPEEANWLQLQLAQATSALNAPEAASEQQQPSPAGSLVAQSEGELDNSIAQQQDENSSTATTTTTQQRERQANSGEMSSSGIRLERRLDALEFQLRKLIHQQRLRVFSSQQQQQASANSKEPLSASDQLTGNNQKQLEDSLSFASKLKLMESVIAISTKKIYYLEERVKKLEKCDCRLSCKWTTPQQQEQDSYSSAGQELESKTSQKEEETPTGTGTGNERAQVRRNETVLVKSDGEVWGNKCDVCSCHSGQVRCKHISCPELTCANPHYVKGKCCPLCFKSCVYRSHTVAHGNKLVINSNQDMCKECLCLDGRLKCQRVELNGGGSSSRKQRSTWRAAGGATGNSPSQSSILGEDLALDSANDENENENEDEDGDDDEAHNRLSEEQQNDLEEVDEEPDYTSGSQGNFWVENELEGGRENSDEQLAGKLNWLQSSSSNKQQRQLGKRSSAHSSEPYFPLVCPQVGPECPHEQRVELQNDCCTYCATFDFCAHKAKFLCHPNAFCLNNLHAHLNSTEIRRLNLSDLQRSPDGRLSMDSMFKCECKRGYQGDGRHCRDIDECAQSHLNRCDSQTTECVNLPAGYQCLCKRGFKPLENNTAPIPTGMGVSNLQPTLPVNQLTKCVDLDECADGKLNRCHPQAKCTNLWGSYKCRCKAGFLGNGIECHRWFSADPNVAAYLHQHQSQTRPLQNKSTQAKLNLPLPTLEGDADDEQVDDEERAYQRDYKEDGEDEEDVERNNNLIPRDQLLLDEQENENQEDSGATGNALQSTNSQPLNGASWMPLKLDSSEFMSNSQQANEQVRSMLMDTQPQHATEDGGAHSSVAAAKQSAPSEWRSEAAALNTRTMFFQPPPPKFWLQKNVTASTTTEPSSTSTTATTTSTIPAGSNQHTDTIFDGNNNSVDNKNASSDTNDSLSAANIQRSSPEVVDQTEPRQTTTSSPSSGDSIMGGETNLHLVTVPLEVPSPHTSHSHSAASSSSQNNNNSPSSYKRGTIIATATSSPIKGRTVELIAPPFIFQKPMSVTSGSSSTFKSPYLAKLDFFNTKHPWTGNRHHCITLIIILLSILHIYCINFNHIVTFPALTG